METVPDGREQDDNPDLGEGEWAILGQVLMSHITLQVYSVVNSTRKHGRY